MTGDTAVGRAAYADALVELSFVSDYDSVTVEEIVERVGGSREEFDQLFPSKQACAVVAVEEMTKHNMRIVRRAFENGGEWPDSLRAGAYAMARWIVEHPHKLRFGMLDTLWAGEMTGAIRDEFFGEFAAMVDEGRAVAPDPEAVPALAAESVIGAITQALMRFGIERGGKRDPVAAVPEMMYLAVRPYLGEEAARRELSIPPPTDY